MLTQQAGFGAFQLTWHKLPLLKNGDPRLIHSFIKNNGLSFYQER